MNIRKLLPRRHTQLFPHWLPLRCEPKLERGSGFKQGQISSGDVTCFDMPKTTKRNHRNERSPEGRPNRNHEYQRNDRNETAETSETTKNKQKHRIEGSRRGQIREYRATITISFNDKSCYCSPSCSTKDYKSDQFACAGPESYIVSPLKHRLPWHTPGDR